MKTPYITGIDAEATEHVARALPDWHELVTIVIERIWYGIATALLVMLVVILHLMRQQPYYRSSAMLMVEVEQPRLLPVQEVVSSNIRSLEYFNTVISILHSHQMMEMALKQSGLDQHRGFLPQLPGLSEKAAAALGFVTIEPVERSRLIQITAEHTDPQLASDLANAMARSYIQRELDNRMSSSMQAVEWLMKLSVEYRDKLDAGMKALQQYRENLQSVSLEEDQNIVIAKLKALNASLSSTQAERIGIQSEWEAIDMQMKNEVPRQRIAPQLQDPVLQDVQAQLQRQRQQIALLRERYREDHPDMRDALQQETHLSRLFDEHFDTAVYALKSRYETLQTTEANLRTALQAQEQESFRLARQLVQYNDLKRNVEADQQLYESVMARMKEADISGSLPTDVIRLADEARPARAPYRPNRPQVLIRGGAIAAVAGLGMIFLLYYADHRFRRNEEVERALGVPVLAALPIVAGKDQRQRGLVSLNEPVGEVSEGFRTLRAILEMNPVAEKAKVLLITSSQPSEGKSLVAVNLAACYAQNNCRTLLIGGDLRRPVLHKIFTGLEQDSGLSNVLAGEMPWQDAVHSGAHENLDVIEAGRKGDRPSELLGGSLFVRIMDELRDTYDKIIIDAPPMLGISDSLILLKQAQAVLFVVRYGVTHSMGASQAMRRIQSSGAPCIGTVMNGVDVHSIANYYYYRHYGGYAYHAYAKAARQADNSRPRSGRRKPDPSTSDDA